MAAQTSTRDGKTAVIGTVKGRFDNDADALQVSPAFVTQYIGAARAIAHEVITATHTSSSPVIACPSRHPLARP